MSIFILDTNTVSDILSQREQVLANFRTKKKRSVFLPTPVDYEVRRGLLARDAFRQLAQYETDFMKLVTYLEIQPIDWHKAAQLWANMRRAGKQLSDMDLLIAAMTLRLEAVLVTSDLDFVPLGVTTEN